ncbi:MAG: glycoside hydrolase family 127 protein [Enterococcus sp.]
MQIKNVNITSKFWGKYRELVVDKVLPYQWSVMNDEEQIAIEDEPGGNPLEEKKSHVLANLKITANQEKGDFIGYPFQDTDAYKWLEAAAYSLAYHPDENLQAITDKLIDLLAVAQDTDGYLVSYFQIEAPERKFKRLQQSHELYTMGHYIEAAVAYYEITGNNKSLEIAEKMAQCIDNSFGPEEEKIHGSDGHPEIELALARLYDVTKNDTYLNLAKYHVDIRGQHHDFYEEQNKADGLENNIIHGMEKFDSSYYQSSGLIKDQEHLDGHAVRVVYLCAGMAHIARVTKDDELLVACNRFWENICNKRMYITGAIGSTNLGERFTLDFDLPNDTMYGETCASVGMIFFAKEMLETTTDSKYGDIIEKELYNGTLAGMALDGEHFFYVNPLEADPEVSKYNPSRSHVLTQRAEWFGCACCPSNIARLIASVDKYIYTTKENVILVDQYISSIVKLDHNIEMEQVNDYPWSESLSINIKNPENYQFKLALRIPEWSIANFKIIVNNKEVVAMLNNGFAYIEISETAVVDLKLDMATKVIQSNPKVRYNFGKVALQRGPIVYCTEECDNGKDLWLNQIKVNGEKEAIYDAKLLGGVVKLNVEAARLILEPNQELYTEYKEIQLEAEQVTFIPYFAWANREEGQMSVWQNVYTK